MAEIDINKLKSKYGYVVLSACRNEKTKKENAERTRELQKTLNAAGFLNEKVYGSYLENGKQPVDEESFIVFPNENHNLSEIIDRCSELADENHYSQDSILVWKPGEQAQYIYTTDVKNDKGEIEHFKGEIGNKFERSTSKVSPKYMYSTKYEPSNLNNKEDAEGFALYNGRRPIESDDNEEYLAARDFTVVDSDEWTKEKPTSVLPDIGSKRQLNQDEEVDTFMENMDKLFADIYEKTYHENVCAGTGAGGISSFAPEHMRGLYVTGSGGGYGLQTDSGKVDKDSTPRPQKIKYAKDCKVKDGESYLMKESEIFENILKYSD